MDIKKELGNLADKVSEKDVKQGIDAIKSGAKKINNDKVSKAVDKVKVSDKDIKGALDALKKL